MFSNNAVKQAIERMADGKVTLENSALVGASMHEGWVPSIPDQYASISKVPVPITVIMDGGGNDVMSVKEDCLAFNDKCRQQIDEALDIAGDLLQKMDDDGIAHVIYMGPFYLLNLNQAVDYGAKKLEKICKKAKIDCHVADTRDLNPPKGDDGIHPTPEGYEMLAKRIWEVKLKHDIPMA
jgi:hypothetical protein